MDPTVGLQGGIVSERLPTGVTDIGPAVRVCSHVRDEREFMSEAVTALLAMPGSAPCVLQQVVVEVGLGFESFITVRTGEFPDIFVD